jgi:predicted Zn-dependent peptidase
LEHIVFKGSQHYPSEQKIGEAIEKYGGSINAYTAEENISFFITSPASAIGKTLPLLFDIVFRPTAIKKEEEIEKEKKVILEEIKWAKDDPDTYISEKTYSLLNPHHPISLPIEGTEESLEDLNSKIIIKWWERFISPSNLTINFGGYIPDKLKEKIEKLLPEKGSIKIKGRPIYKSPRQPRMKIFKRKLNQIKIKLLFDSDSLSLKEKIYLSLISRILGKGLNSILFKELRSESGLCYDVHALSETFKDFAVFDISTGVSQEKLEEALDKIMVILNKVKKGFSKKEIENAKMAAKGEIEISSDKPSFIANFPLYLEMSLGKIISIKELFGIISEANFSNLKALSRKVFNTKNLTLGILGNLKDDKILKKAINKLKD